MLKNVAEFDEIEVRPKWDAGEACFLIRHQSTRDEYVS